MKHLGPTVQRIFPGKMPHKLKVSKCEWIRKKLNILLPINLGLFQMTSSQNIQDQLKKNQSATSSSCLLEGICFIGMKTMAYFRLYFATWFQLISSVLNWSLMGWLSSGLFVIIQDIALSQEKVLYKKIWYIYLTCFFFLALFL